MVRMYDRNEARIDGNLVGICFWAKLLSKTETAKTKRNLSCRRDAWSRLQGQRDRSKIRKMNAHHDREFRACALRKACAGYRVLRSIGLNGYKPTLFMVMLFHNRNVVVW